MRKVALLLAVLSIPVLVALGCGKDETPSSAASVVPAGSQAYGEVDLGPSGDQKKAIDALVGKFPGEGDTAERLRSLIEEGLRDSEAPITFEEDVEPWLGDTAAFFVKGAEPESSAALVATTDDDAARDAIEKSFEGDAREKTYEGVDYLSDGEGAGGVVDGFVVLGNEAALKAAVDTSDGGSPLEDDEAYKDAIADVAEDRLGLFYINMPALQQVLQRQQPALGSFGDLFEEPLVTTFDVDRDGVTFEADAPRSLAATTPFLGQGSELVNELPADSWLALAQPDLGKLLDYYVDAFGQAAGGREALAGRLSAITGLDLDRDLLGWMGDFGVFVRGASLAELNGAVVIETTDPAASARLITRLGMLARRSQPTSGTTIEPLAVPGEGEGLTLRDDEIPAPVHLFQRGDRVVLAYGDAAAEDALDPAQRLGDSAEFAEAAKSLDGYAVSFYLAAAPVLELADSAAGGDADWQRARPYLEPLKALVGGTAGDDDELHSAFKILIE